MYVCSAARLLALYALVLGSTYGTLVASDVLLSRWTSSLDEEEEEGEAGGAVRWLWSARSLLPVRTQWHAYRR